METDRIVRAVGCDQRRYLWCVAGVLAIAITSQLHVDQVPPADSGHDDRQWRSEWHVGSITGGTDFVSSEFTGDQHEFCHFRDHCWLVDSLVAVHCLQLAIDQFVGSWRGLRNVAGNDGVHHCRSGDCGERTTIWDVESRLR